MTDVATDKTLGGSREMPSNPQFASSTSGLDELLERECQDALSANEELRELAMRIARNENVSAGEYVSAAEIDAILTDCYATPAMLKKMVAEAKEKLELVDVIGAEGIDAVELATFQDEAQEALREIAANEAKIRGLIVATEGAKNQVRLALVSRYAKTENIARKAAEAAASLANAGTVTTRTPAVVRSLPTVCRNTEWLDAFTRIAIDRKKVEVRPFGAAGQLPVVVPIQIPDCMIDPTPTSSGSVEPELPAIVEPEAPEVAEWTPTLEAPARHRARRRADGVATPGDLTDEPSDLG